MGDEQLTFSHTIESVVASLGPALTPALREKMRVRGIDPDRKLLPAYPRTTWAEVLADIAAEVHPALPRNEAHRLIGRNLARAYNHTGIGAAIANVLLLRGPARTLTRMTQTLRSGNNYSDTRLTKLGDREFELWVNEVNGSPGYIQGILETVLENSGATNILVRVQSFDGHAATYHVRW
jgi:uncharacterized protein (TIGR02265 family)